LGALTTARRWRWPNAGHCQHLNQQHAPKPT
jgi:hypothetical protein